MKRLTIFILLTLAGISALTGQENMDMGDYGHANPDSLVTVHLSGLAMVDSSHMYAQYFLDENEDGNADYRLSFGPHWYSPDSSDAVRPNDGDPITISGGLRLNTHDSLNMVIVYEIHGEFWRDPVAPTWNYMGMHNNVNGHHNGMGYAFGWMHDSIKTVNLSGTVLSDTTFIFNQYYLDTDQDSLPDYYLNFGPPWYSPQNGAERPQNGQEVTILGGLMGAHDIEMVVVYEIDGIAWRDSTAFGNHFGGGWFTKEMTGGRYFHSAYDSLDGMMINQGWNDGNMNHGHGGMMSDSLFCQILEVFPQNIPNSDNLGVMAGYEVAMFKPDGNNNMWMDGQNGNHMNFSSQVDFTLHYTDEQMMSSHMDESTLGVSYWDNQSSSWKDIQGPILDKGKNTLTFSSNEVSNFVVITGDEKVTAIGDAKNIVHDFALKQNYPNPFNPVTIIPFEINKTSRVRLTIYNVLGQKIATVTNRVYAAGIHKINFNAENLSSGMYIYKLEVNGRSAMRQMLLMK